MKFSVLLFIFKKIIPHDDNLPGKLVDDPEVDALVDDDTAEVPHHGLHLEVLPDGECILHVVILGPGLLAVAQLANLR